MNICHKNALFRTTKKKIEITFCSFLGIVFSCSACILAVVHCRWGSTWEHLQALRGSAHLHAVKPKSPHYHGVSLLLLVLLPSRTLHKNVLLRCKPNGFQLWLLRRYLYNKVIVLEFEYIQVGYEIELQEVFLWLKISAQQGEIKELERLKSSF